MVKKTEEWKKRMSKIMLGKNLGRKRPKDFGDNLSESLKGENSSNWKGGVTSEENIIRSRRETLSWKKAVKDRDNWTCRNCGKENLSGHNCHAHHVKDFNEYPELRLDTNNGITLCMSCHKKIHVKEINR